VCSHAAEGGHLETLKWLREHESPPFDEETCAGAAQGGHLEVLKWLRMREQDCPWGPSSVRELALRGDMEMMRWALQHGCPTYGGSGMYGPGDLCHMIAQHGDLEMLKCVVELGCPMDEAVGSLRISTRLTLNILLLICTARLYAHSP